MKHIDHSLLTPQESAGFKIYDKYKEMKSERDKLLIEVAELKAERMDEKEVDDIVRDVIKKAENVAGGDDE